VKERFGTDFKQVRHESIAKTGRCEVFFGVGRWERHCFDNHQSLDLAGLNGRLLSSSYAPKEGHPSFSPMMAALKDLFVRTQKGGVIRMDYTTELFLGRLG
jgi:hypothetical protein